MHDIADHDLTTDLGTARGYAVGCLESVRLGPEIQAYMEDIESTFEPFGGEWVVHGTQPEVVEGTWQADVVIIGFPSLQAARDWYASPAYQRILGLRVAHSTSHVFLLEGVPDGYRAEQTVAKLFAPAE
jgi:uncharacterized protein (DUF1330 family)